MIHKSVILSHVQPGFLDENIFITKVPEEQNWTRGRSTVTHWTAILAKRGHKELAFVNRGWLVARWKESAWSTILLLRGCVLFFVKTQKCIDSLESLSCWYKPTMNVPQSTRFQRVQVVRCSSFLLVSCGVSHPHEILYSEDQFRSTPTPLSWWYHKVQKTKQLRYINYVRASKF